MSVIEEQWAEFWGEVQPANPAVNQKEEMRGAFFAGWFSALRRLAVVPDDDRRKHMEDIWHPLWREAVDVMNTEIERRAQE